MRKGRDSGMKCVVRHAEPPGRQHCGHTYAHTYVRIYKCMYSMYLRIKLEIAFLGMMHETNISYSTYVDMYVM